jgi:DMSO reductase anchor subunit
MPADTYAASDWNIRPEHPHWPLVWLTLTSQLAFGVSATARTQGLRLVAAALAAAALLGALAHLGRPIAAWKAFRNLRRSWLSREVALLSAYAGLAALAAVVSWAAGPAAVLGAAGVYASARVYIVPGRPAWNTRLTLARFFASSFALGAVVTGHAAIAAAGVAVALAATALNWLRLGRGADPAHGGAVWLELGWFRLWSVTRFGAGAIAIAAALAGAPPFVVLLCAAACEVIGRWLFYTAVVPLNMPGAFWRGAAGAHR